MKITFDMDTKSVEALMDKTSLKGVKKAELSVSYDTPYALYVHEDLTANHPNGGQAKFLEEPARRLAQQMTEIVAKFLRQKKGLLNGLRKAGELLLETSKPLVPVDTGRLRDSGRVEVVEVTT